MKILIFTVWMVAVFCRNWQRKEFEHDAARILNGTKGLETVLGLKEAAWNHRNVDAMDALVDIFIYGMGGQQPDFVQAKETCSLLANTTFSSKAHFYLAWIEDEGLCGPRNPEKALIHLLISASEGHLYALAALGYKYDKGINLNPECSTAAYLYRLAAKKIIQWPEFRTYAWISHPNVYLYKDDEQFSSKSDMIQYYDLTRKRDSSVSMSLGVFYCHGGSRSDIDHVKAREYFELAAADGVGDAYGYLGDLYRCGNGIEQDYTKALEHYQLGSELESPMAWNGLGIMYLNGYGVEKSVGEAIKYFSRAIGHEYVDSKYHLGKIYIESKSKIKATRGLNYLKSAASNNHVLALFEYGQFLLKSRESAQCHEPKGYLQIVVKRGLGDLVQEALEDYRHGRRTQSLVKHMVLSYLGHEAGHLNAAYLLEQDLVYKRAFVYWNRGAMQGNMDAKVRTGDYYYYGYGVPASSETAADIYHGAEALHSPHAAFNIGYMHEYGIGVELDLELAKRYYDRALEYDPKAYFPVSLAMLKLQMKMRLESSQSVFSWSFDWRRWVSQLKRWNRGNRWMWMYFQRLLFGLILMVVFFYYSRMVYRLVASRQRLDRMAGANRRPRPGRRDVQEHLPRRSEGAQEHLSRRSEDTQVPATGESLGENSR